MTDRTRNDDDCRDFLYIGGSGSLHDLRDADRDPRNPRLSGLKSVSYAAAVAMGPRQNDKPRRVGFAVPRARK